jgi:rubrerythrin
MRAYVTPVAKQPAQAPQEKTTPTQQQQQPSEMKKKLWYCKQCGYVVFREEPPYVCPICKAKREMFAKIESTVELNG